jgi:ElaB/YqjD/DUF883 family membrane-anchored ribosome-binding protein
MTDAEKIAALEAQVKTLTERMDDLFEGWKRNSLKTANHIRRIDVSLMDVRDGLNITYRELFPGVRADYRKIDDILLPLTTRDKKNR